MAYKNSSKINDILAKKYELISTSYHEAGHVIAGLLCYMKINYASVTDKGKRASGETYFDTLNDVCDINDNKLLAYELKSRIYLSYAGLAVEKMFYEFICGSTRFPIHLKDGSSFDIEVASDIIKKYKLSPAGKKRFLFKKRMFSEVSKILNSHWEDIILISRALFNKKKLNYSNIKKILYTQSNNKDFWKEKFKIIYSIYKKKQKENTIKQLIKMC